METILKTLTETVVTEKQLKVCSHLYNMGIADKYFLTVKYGNDIIASEDDEIMLRTAKTILELNKLPYSKIAFIGGGTCVAPRLINNPSVKIDVYELFQELCDWNKENTLGADQWNLVGGDYKDTLSGDYDAIIFDAPPNCYDEALLLKHTTKIIDCNSL